MAIKRKSANHGAEPVEEMPVEKTREIIATNAYFRAQQRNFLPGYEEADWLAAELEMNEILRRNILQ